MSDGDIHIPAGTLRQAFLKLAEGKSPAEAHDVLETASMQLARAMVARGFSKASLPFLAAGFLRSLEADYVAPDSTPDENARPGPS